MSLPYTDWHIWQDPEVVSCFTNRRRGGIIGGDVQLETMLRLLRVVEARRPVDGKFSVLDLGCGDGVLLHTIQTAFSKVRGVALDGSPIMLEKARGRLDTVDVTFVLADYNDDSWLEHLPYDHFDAVVSGFAIHHSEDERKRAIYRQIFGLLRLGGVFVNIEHVASASRLGERLFEEAFAENEARLRHMRGDDVTVDIVLQELRQRPDKDANQLAPLETQLGWLREIGFVDVDCYWKQFELAVLAGYRPQVR